MRSPKLPVRARRRPSRLVFLTGNVIPWTLVRPTTRLDQLIEQDFDLIQLHLLDRRTRYAFARPGPEISGLQMSAGDGVALAPADEEDVGRVRGVLLSSGVRDNLDAIGCAVASLECGRTIVDGDVSAERVGVALRMIRGKELSHSAPPRADHFLDDVAGEERNVGRPLCQPAHEIRIPLRAERNIDAHAVALANQRVLKIAANSVEHLELEARRLDRLLDGEALRLANECFVMCCDAGIIAVEHELTHAADIVVINLFLFGVGDSVRLLVRALADADASTHAVRIFDIRKSAIEITLQNYPDMLAICGEEPLLEEIERSLRVGASLHVETNEASVFSRAIEDVLNDPGAELFGDVEAHRGELHRDVRVELALVYPIEHGEVFAAGCAYFGFVVHALAKQVERRRNATLIQPLHCRQRRIERFSRDKPVCKPVC